MGQINFITDVSLEDKFNQYHRNNKGVYELYKKFAFQLINSGAKKIGSKMIIERIRWETKIKTKGGVYKINNNHTAFYARLFERDFPQHSEIFFTRRLRQY